MPIIKQYKCDGCGALKKEANRWWVLRVANTETILMTIERGEQISIAEGDLILCGQDCVSKKNSEWMGGKVRATGSQADGERQT